MGRIDLNVLEWSVKEMNGYYQGREGGIGFFEPNEDEDYGLDLVCTGRTKDGSDRRVEFEEKVITDKFTHEYLTRVAGRNRKCRYCYSADTQEEFDNDTTPMPDWLTGGTPVHVLNSTDKYGRLTGKIHRLLEANAGLVYVMEGAILIYSPSAVRNAILGYIWIKCKHTEYFEDNGERWERKAVIDLTKYSTKIKCNVPKEYLNDKQRYS